MSSAEAAVSLRVLRALAGRTGPDRDAARSGAASGEPSADPRTDVSHRWQPQAALTWRFVARLVSPARRVLRRVDDALALLVRRPVLVVGGLVPLVPLARLGLPGTAGTHVAVALVAAVLLLLTLAVAAAFHPDPHDRRVVLRLVAAGALLRGGFALAIAARGGFPDETSTYAPLAADAAASWSRGATSILAEHVYVLNRAVWFYLLGGAFLVTGPTLAVGRVVASCVGLLGAVMAGEVARGVGGRRAAVFGVALLALHPEHAFWNATLARDGTSVLLVLTTLAVLVRRPGRLLRGTGLAGLVCLGLLWWNSYMVTLWLAATLAVLVSAEGLDGARRGVGGALRAGVAATFSIAALVFAGYRYGPYVTPAVLTEVRALGVGAVPDLFPDLVFTSWLDVAAFAPVGALHVLAAPLPWNAVHAQRAAYAVLALGGLAVTVTGLAGLFHLLRHAPARVAPLAVFAVFALVTLSMVEGVDGIVVRHRMPLTAVLAVCAAVALAGGATSDVEADAAA